LVFLGKKEAIAIFFPANPLNSCFVRAAQEQSKTFRLNLLLLCYVYVGRLNAAANPAVFASKTHLIGENDIFEVQGEWRIMEIG